MLNFESIVYTGDKTHMSSAEFHQLIADKSNDAIAPISTSNNKKSKGKYRSNKFSFRDKVFDSEKEAKRYADLLKLQDAGIIKNLELQKRYELIPTQRDKNGKIIEKSCSYYADFVYERCDGVVVVEDVKSPATKTPLYIVKRKLMLYKYGIRITEIE